MPKAVYSRVLAKTMCRASDDAYPRADGRFDIAEIKDRWNADVAELISVDGTEALCLSGPLIVIIAFRGTSGFRDVLRDTTAKRAVWYSREKVAVHEGILNGWRSVKLKIREWGKANGWENKEVLITGHSLGAGLANLAAFDLDVMTSGKMRPILYTFASPRVGDRRFKEFCNSRLVDRHFRHTQGNDLITKVPLVFRANMFLPDFMPLIPTPRRLWHNGQHKKLDRHWRPPTNNPISWLREAALDHQITRYHEALT